MKTIYATNLTRWMDVLLGVLFLASLAWMSYGNIEAGAEPWQLAISALLLSVPLGLFYFTIALLVHAFEQIRSLGQLSRRVANALYLAPRIAGVLITIFVSLFALDVFEGNHSFWEMAGAFLIHALPAILLAVCLALAWRHAWIGSLAFLAAAFYFFKFLAGDLKNGIGIFLLFIGPMFMVAILFGVNWKWRAEISRSRQENPQFVP